MDVPGGGSSLSLPLNNLLHFFFPTLSPHPILKKKTPPPQNGKNGSPGWAKTGEKRMKGGGWQRRLGEKMKNSSSF